MLHAYSSHVFLCTVLLSLYRGEDSLPEMPILSMSPYSDLYLYDKYAGT